MEENTEKNIGYSYETVIFGVFTEGIRILCANQFLNSVQIYKNLSWYTVAKLKYGTILISDSDLVDYLKKYLSYKKASYTIGKP